MGSQIIKVSPDQDLYLEWSSVVDAPTRVGTRAEFTAYLNEPRRGETWMTAAQIEQRLWLADETGSSAYRPFGISWDHRGSMYQQQGILPRARLAEYAQRLLVDIDAEPGDLLEPFDDERTHP
jgi:hypothetical protein